MTQGRRIRRSALACLCAALAAGCAKPTPYRDARLAHDLVNKATITIATFGESPDHPDVRAALHHACAVFVFPQVASVGVVAGGSIGSGVLLARDDASGRWVGPVFYAMDEVSAGPQVALAKRELIVVLHQCESLSAFEGQAVTLRFGASMGAQAAGHGDARGIARDVRAYSKVQGLVVGAALDAVAVHVRQPLSDAYYGDALTPAEVLSPVRPCDDASREIRAMVDLATK